MYQLLKKEITLFSPINGRKIDLDKVPDQVFSSYMMGNGIGFINESNKVYAPCNAKVIMIASTKHAIGLKTKMGVEILIHIGLDTIQLMGKGFYVHVKNNERVKKGDLLISYDKELIENKHMDLTIPMVITNSNDYDIEFLKENEQVTLNSQIIRISKR